MKTKILAIAILAVISLSALLYVSHRNITRLKAEVSRYQTNTDVLMRDVERYRTADSLNVAKVGVLSLKLAEVEELRSADMKLIESLKVKAKELEQYTTIQMETIANLKGQVRDSIVYVDRVVADTVQSLNVSDKWIDLHGVIYRDGLFDGTLEVRDSIMVVETVQHARFLGFLWRTKRVKSRQIDVTNKNPYTQIVGVESVKIEK